MGDVNGDFRNDYNDFLIFKRAFDAANGNGAFAASLATPEPTALGLMALAVGCGAALRGRRGSGFAARGGRQQNN
jgi:hypothetical protein